MAWAGLTPSFFFLTPWGPPNANPGRTQVPDTLRLPPPLPPPACKAHPEHEEIRNWAAEMWTVYLKDPLHLSSPLGGLQGTGPGGGSAGGGAGRGVSLDPAVAERYGQQHHFGSCQQSRPEPDCLKPSWEGPALGRRMRLGIELSPRQHAYNPAQSRTYRLSQCPACKGLWVRQSLPPPPFIR